MDVVRALFAAVNRGAVDEIAALYHAEAIVEHVFTDDDRVYEGSAAIRSRWKREIDNYRGLLSGDHRIAIARIAGIETGWGWVRADWSTAVRDLASGVEQRRAGYSHFWIEGGLIRRHRSVVVGDHVPDVLAPPPDAGVAVRDNSRGYPSRPITGIGAVIRQNDGRVVLVKRRFEPLARQWSLPGGALEVGETLESGVAREVLEETGLVVDVGPVVEVFDRILVDETGRVRYHYVLIDYLCRPRGGDLRPGGDVADVALAMPAELAEYRVTDKVRDVVRKASLLQI